MSMVEQSRDLPVTLDGHTYSIKIGRGILAGAASFLAKRTADRKVLLVVDDACRAPVVEPFIGALEQHGFQVLRHDLAGGKCNKSIEEAIRIYTTLEAHDFARDSTLIAIGGGVTGDIAGFVAGTYFRGMNLVHVPTTMMAMVDSSVGGKTGINFLGRVNVIGCYHHPILNVIDFQLIDTLSDRDYRAGLAEVIKCAVLCAPDLFSYLRRERRAVLERDHASLLHVVERAVAIKLAHVTGDVYEQGQRLKLNYGHTLGHAIEASTAHSYDVFRHGEGVALGMVGAAHIARSFLPEARDTLAQHEEILLEYGLPIHVDVDRIGFQRDTLRRECLRNVQKDKKRKNNGLRLILPRAVGSCEVYDGVPQTHVERAFDYLLRTI